MGREFSLIFIRPIRNIRVIRVELLLLVFAVDFG